PFPEKPGEDGTRFEGQKLQAFRPVILDGKRIGTIYLQADLTGILNRLKLFAGIAALVLAGAMLMALALASRLQRPITEPIVALADTARSIAERKDYSVRAAPRTQREFRVL